MCMITSDLYTCKVRDNSCEAYRAMLVKKLEQAGIFKRFQNCTFTTIELLGVPKEIQKPYGQVKDFAANLPDNLEAGKGLLLRGPVGTMKTSLAVAVLQEQIRSCRGGMLLSLSSLLDQIFSLKDRERLHFENSLRETPLLVLDDMGAEHTEGWVLTKVDAIISERWNRCKSIIITTNLTTEQLKKTYAERVIDRLRNTLQEVVFAGPSQRGKA